MVQYPIVLERDDGTIMVTFPDFPEAHTFGADREEALMRAPDALATIIDAYIRDRRDLPTPSPIKRTTATLSALMSAKVELYRAMRAAGVTKSEPARRLDWHLPQVDRLFDLRHGSQLDQLEAAAKAVGCFLDVNFHTSSRPKPAFDRSRQEGATADDSEPQGGESDLRPARSGGHSWRRSSNDQEAPEDVEGMSQVTEALNQSRGDGVPLAWWQSSLPTRNPTFGPLSTIAAVRLNEH